MTDQRLTELQQGLCVLARSLAAGPRTGRDLFVRAAHDQEPRTYERHFFTDRLGLRRGLLPQLLAMEQGAVDFLECAPENWIGVGGAYGQGLDRLAERFAIACHGLSLSLGGSLPLDQDFLARTKQFLERYQVRLYSEHLSYCSDDGHLYDLMPIPFTDEAVHHVSARIRQAQDVLQRRIAVENISYYAAPYQAMSELEFIRAVLEESDCDLLLDVNNVYVNACNHGYDAAQFLDGLPHGG